MKTTISTTLDIDDVAKIKSANLKYSDLILIGMRYKIGNLIANEEYKRDDELGDELGTYKEQLEKSGNMVKLLQNKLDKLQNKLEQHNINYDDLVYEVEQ